MKTALSWGQVEEYVAAGNVATFAIENDFETLNITIFYGNGKREVTVNICCRGCCYFDGRRSEGNNDGDSAILEAYLHEESWLIAALRNRSLDTKSGGLEYDPAHGVRHLEVIGEFNLNVLAAQFVFTASELVLAQGSR